MQFWFCQQTKGQQRAASPAADVGDPSVCACAGTAPAHQFVWPAWFSPDSAWQLKLLEDKDEWLRLHEAAVAGDFDAWQDQGPLGSLALVLLLDQFGRTILKGDPRSVGGDAKGVTVARAAIARGDDAAVPEQCRFWFYFPLMHSETEADQEQSLALFRALAASAPGSEPLLPSAQAHHAAVARFGRLPGRNKMLGRPSTDEEIRYMRSSGNP